MAADEHLATTTGLGDRAETRGEAIIAICRDLRKAISGGGDWEGLIDQLERQADGTSISGDVRNLRRLINMKRVPDVEARQQEMLSHVRHAIAVAHEWHHLEARAKPNRQAAG